MSEQSDRFERLIWRVNELIQGDGAVVTWDDKIIDPHSPNRRRQIDVTIRRDGLLTFVECRDHQGPQDAQWIEQLIGRRLALGADGIIGVSSSGFTSTALNTAQAMGIVLRDVRDLSDAEICDWGRALKVRLYFFHFPKFNIELVFAAPPTPVPADAEVKAALCRPEIARMMFNAVASQVDKYLFPAQPKGTVRFDIGIGPEWAWSIDGNLVAELRVSGEATLREMPAEGPIVRSYEAPTATSDAMIQIFDDMGETAVIHEGENVACTIDLTGIELPMSLFRYAAYESEAIRNYARFEIVGIERMMRWDSSVSVILSARGNLKNMANQRPLGMLATCARCGGANEWTGKERRGDPIIGLGDDAQHPNEYETLAEYRCASCGDTDWAAIGANRPE